MVGNCTIYSSAWYNGLAAAPFDCFWLIADAIRDGKVSMADISAAGRAFDSNAGDPNTMEWLR
jgi:hypothetical protein